MTLWELCACIDGFNRANSAPTVEHVPQDQLDAMIEEIKKKDASLDGKQ